MRAFHLHPDGSGVIVELTPGPFSFSPPIESVVVELSAAEVGDIWAEKPAPKMPPPAQMPVPPPGLLEKIRALVSAGTPVPAAELASILPADPAKGT